MMRIAFLLTFIVPGTILHAQKGIDGLIRAERDFAAHSVAHGTKAAFLFYLDSSGIVFEKGEPVNGIHSWTAKEARQGTLNWWPSDAGISASGDFGFTTGPWEFRATPNDTPSGRGRFTTVWHKTQTGAWKFLVDLGVGQTPADTNTSVSRHHFKGKFSPGTATSLVEAEQELIAAAAVSSDRAYRQKASGDLILQRNGQAALRSGWREGYLPEGIGFTVLGSGIAPSGDLGYVYGKAVLKDKTDNYLRIWRREGNEWKLALQVLRF